MVVERNVKCCFKFNVIFNEKMRNGTAPRRSVTMNTMNGEPILRHLGNFITHDLSDLNDITYKKGVFISQVNRLNARFPFASSGVKGHLQATGLDAWASRLKCPARFVSHLHEICIYIYIWVVYSRCFFCCLFITVTWWYVCVVYWVGKWQSRGSTGMFGNLMAIYHIMLQFIQNHSRFVMLMIWK